VTCLCQWHPGSKSEKRSPHLRRLRSDSNCTKAQEPFGQIREFTKISLKLRLKILVGAANEPSYDQPCLKSWSRWLLKLLGRFTSWLLVCLLGGVPGIRSAEELQQAALAFLAVQSNRAGKSMEMVPPSIWSWYGMNWWCCYSTNAWENACDRGRERVEKCGNTSTPFQAFFPTVSIAFLRASSSRSFA